MIFGFLLFPDAEELDFVGPYIIRTIADTARRISARRLLHI